MAMTPEMQNTPTGPTPEDAPDTGASGGGLPMRGLAMILIAVAVLLAAWALWSLNSGDDEPAAGGSADATQTEAQLVPGTTTPAAGAERESTADTAAQQPGTDGETPAPAPQQPAAAAGTPVNTLHVLNNSTVPQLAARVAEQLEGDYPQVESGNLPDVVTPRNTVYFTPGNPEAEQAARELADRVHGVAMARPDNLPRETEGPATLVLVLVQDVNL